MYRLIAPDGAGEKYRYQTRSYQDTGADDNHPLLKITPLQKRQLLAESGEDTFWLIFRLHLWFRPREKARVLVGRNPQGTVRYARPFQAAPSIS